MFSILCMQEVQHDHFTKQIKPFLEKHGSCPDTDSHVMRNAGYESVYMRKPDNRNDGCLTAWLHEQFTCADMDSWQECRTVSFKYKDDKQEGHVLDKPNVGALCINMMVMY